MTKAIKKRVSKDCVICGKKIRVIIYIDKSYRGGHYFGKLLKNAEYWECLTCYKRS